jgi:hypothetical protein
VIKQLDFQIESRLKMVECGVFKCGKLPLVTFSSLLLVIRRSAFQRALIEDVSFEQYSKLEQIKREVFYESKVRKMIISPTVTHIGKHAFAE